MPRRWPPPPRHRQPWSPGSSPSAAFYSLFVLDNAVTLDDNNNARAQATDQMDRDRMLPEGTDRLFENDLAAIDLGIDGSRETGRDIAGGHRAVETALRASACGEGESHAVDLLRSGPLRLFELGELALLHDPILFDHAQFARRRQDSQSLRNQIIAGVATRNVLNGALLPSFSTSPRSTTLTAIELSAFRSCGPSVPGRRKHGAEGVYVQQNSPP